MKHSFLSKYWFQICVLLTFCIHVFFQFYQLQSRSIFGWDQVNNAWAAIRILKEHSFPLLGMVAKGNSGMYIGPLYYYFVSVFYFFTNLDPIASPIIAATTSIISFITILFVAYKLYGKNVALLSLLIYSFSSFIIRSERLQWPVNFIAPVSLLLFYALYKVINGRQNYLPLLALLVGLSFHVHFTSIFYPIIIICTLPILPWKKLSWKTVVLSILIFVLLFIPQIIYFFQSKNSGAASNYLTYFQTYFHGFHLRRVVQMGHDAFIQFESILSPFRFLRPTVFFYIILYSFFAIKKFTFQKIWKLLYLNALWIIVPWFIFSTYSGEISDYYFFISQFTSVMMLSCIIVWVMEYKIKLINIIMCLLLAIYAYANISVFFSVGKGNLQTDRITVQQKIQTGQTLQFTEGDPQYYLYHIYTHYQKGQ